MHFYSISNRFVLKLPCNGFVMAEAVRYFVRERWACYKEVIEGKEYLVIVSSTRLLDILRKQLVVLDLIGPEEFKLLDVDETNLPEESDLVRCSDISIIAPAKDNLSAWSRGFNVALSVKDAGAKKLLKTIFPAEQGQAANMHCFEGCDYLVWKSNETLFIQSSKENLQSLAKVLNRNGIFNGQEDYIAVIENIKLSDVRALSSAYPMTSWAKSTFRDKTSSPNWYSVFPSLIDKHAREKWGDAEDCNLIEQGALPSKFFASDEEKELTLLDELVGARNSNGLEDRKYISEALCLKYELERSTCQYFSLMKRRGDRNAKQDEWFKNALANAADEWLGDEESPVDEFVASFMEVWDAVSQKMRFEEYNRVQAEKIKSITHISPTRITGLEQMTNGYGGWIHQLNGGGYNGSRRAKQLYRE